MEAKGISIDLSKYIKRDDETDLTYRARLLKTVTDLITGKSEVRSPKQKKSYTPPKPSIKVYYGTFHAQHANIYLCMENCATCPDLCMGDKMDGIYIPK